MGTFLLFRTTCFTMKRMTFILHKRKDTAICNWRLDKESEARDKVKLYLQFLTSLSFLQTNTYLLRLIASLSLIWQKIQ